MIPLISATDVICYITEQEFAEFVAINSDYTVETAIGMLDRERVFSKNGSIYWDKNMQMTETQRKWVMGFFDVHPFIYKIKIMFES